MIPRDLVDRALDVNAANLAPASESTRVPGGVLVRNRETPDIYDANHVMAISAADDEEIDELFRRAEQEFAPLGHRRFDVDYRVSPLVPARLSLEGYERADAIVMMLTGDLQLKPPEHRVEPVDSEDRWSEFARLKAADWAEHSERRGRSGEPQVAEAMAYLARRKFPEVRYWLAYLDGKPAGFFSSWPGIGGTGQVEDLFTLPECRNKGVAAALIRQAVGDCRARGASALCAVPSSGRSRPDIPDAFLKNTRCRPP